MKNLKKLNRKGFTLIELLAVIVILAVIMVIASTSVLSSMNESRKKSLLNSAETAADAFNTAYAESALVTTTEILGLQKYDNTTTPEGGGDPVTTYGVLSGTKSIALTNAMSSLDINDTDYDLANSYVYFNPSNSSFLVCFAAKQGGNFYVGAAASTNKKMIGSEEKYGASTMWACSDGTHSW